MYALEWEGAETHGRRWPAWWPVDRIVYASTKINPKIETVTIHVYSCRLRGPEDGEGMKAPPTTRFS